MITKKLYIAVWILTAVNASFAYDPPKLVSASPPLWAVGVDAAAQKIVSLTFDQPMRPGFSAWFGPSSLTPESNSATSMSPDRTIFKLGVTLLPGKVYAFGLNEKHIPAVGFQTEKGISLPPTFLVFQTVGALAPDDSPPHVKLITPANGAQQIDPSRTRTIVIMFDQPMGTKKHGLHLFENNNLVDLSRFPFSYSADGRTFALPYNFKPAAHYRLELNSVNDIGFARANRIPLWPLQISFTTG